MNRSSGLSPQHQLLSFPPQQRNFFQSEEQPVLQRNNATFNQVHPNHEGIQQLPASVRNNTASSSSSNSDNSSIETPSASRGQDFTPLPNVRAISARSRGSNLTAQLQETDLSINEIKDVIEALRHVPDLPSMAQQLEKSTESYGQIISQQKETIASLRRSLTSLKYELHEKQETLRQTTRKKQRVILSLQDQLAKRTTESEELSISVKNLKEENTVLSQQIKTETERSGRILAEKNELERNFEEMCVEKERVDRQNEKISADVSTHEAHNKELNDKLEDNQNIISSMQQKNTHQIIEIRDLQNRSTQEKIRNNQLENKLQELKKGKSILHDEQQKINESLQNLITVMKNYSISCQGIHKQSIIHVSRSQEVVSSLKLGFQRCEVAYNEFANMTSSLNACSRIENVCCILTCFLEESVRFQLKMLKIAQYRTAVMKNSRDLVHIYKKKSDVVKSLQIAVSTIGEAKDNTPTMWNVVSTLYCRWNEEEAIFCEKINTLENGKKQLQEDLVERDKAVHDLGTKLHFCNSRYNECLTNISAQIRRMHILIKVLQENKKIYCALRYASAELKAERSENIRFVTKFVCAQSDDISHLNNELKLCGVKLKDKEKELENERQKHNCIQTSATKQLEELKEKLGQAETEKNKLETQLATLHVDATPTEGHKRSNENSGCKKSRLRKRNGPSAEISEKGIDHEKSKLVQVPRESPDFKAGELRSDRPSSRKKTHCTPIQEVRKVRKLGNATQGGLKSHQLGKDTFVGNRPILDVSALEEFSIIPNKPDEARRSGHSKNSLKRSRDKQDDREERRAKGQRLPKLSRQTMNYSRFLRSSKSESDDDWIVKDVTAAK